MPTERFYRLSEEKKAAIRKAAIEEFVREPFEKVSINQMIQHAGISRGSFYTYFEDKEDVLRYIFDDTKGRIMEFCKETLVRNKGDFWTTMEELMEYTVEYCDFNNLALFSRNMMLCQELHHMKPYEEEREMSEWLQAHIDKSKWRITDECDIRALMTLGMMNIMAAIGRFFVHQQQMERVKEQFRIQMRLIRYGVEKQN